MITDSSSHFHVSGNEWQRYPFPMPRQQLPPTQSAPAATRIHWRQAFHPLLYFPSNHPKRNNISIKLHSYGDSSFCISSVREHNLSVTESYAMKALNAASLTPLSVLCERRAETRKSLSLPTVSPLKFSHSDSLSASRSAAQECLSRTLHGGVVLLSSVLSTGLARA